MPLYEHVYIARQDVSPQQVEDLTGTLQSVISQGGGKVARSEYWGLRNLQYKIKKNRKGHYTLLQIDAPADALHEMERQARLNEDILRFMTIRVDALSEEQSPILTKRDRDRGDRGDRGGRGGRRFERRGD